MPDEEIEKLIAAYGFTGGEATKVAAICREVERETRHNFFAFIQHANNAANAKSVSPRELDNFFWHAGHAKAKATQPQTISEPSR